MEISVYLAKEVWQQEGLCTVKGRTKGAEFDTELDNGSFVMPRFLDAYLDSDGTAHADSMSILLSNGTESTEFLIHNPPCAKSPVTKGDLTYKAEDEVLVFSFPRLSFSGLEKYVIHFGGNVSFIIPASLGQIKKTVPEYTGENPEKLTLAFNDSNIAPGESAAVFYVVRGSKEELMYRVSIFETSVWTSAEVVGCGLYKNDAFYEGGLNTAYDSARFTHEDLRWLVKFRNEVHALKASDFTSYSLGERVSIVKKGVDGNASTTGKASSASVRDRLDENDLIVPFSFYRGHL